ncbi:MAG: hypothetical protein JWO73_812 [Candidatus Taylorbacteria bacterium]|nr:hypothetical protein [Candidatus Taylorbacteria bacterium]
MPCYSLISTRNMNDIFRISVDTLWFIVPCLLVNSALNLFYETKRKYDAERYDMPFDFGLFLGKNRILGQSTTWGGLLISLLIGLLLSYFFADIHGLAIGLGCFFGHALGSFIKRRFGIARGAYLPIVDHGDYVLLTGALLLLSSDLPIEAYAAGVVSILVMHPIICIVAHKAGFRDNPL